MWYACAAVSSDRSLAPPPAAGEGCAPTELRLRVACLVQAYREHGHRAARVDPLGLQPRPPVAELTLDRFGLSEHTVVEMDAEGLVHGGVARGTTSVGELVEYLDSTYCGGITIETSQIPVSMCTYLRVGVFICACMCVCVRARVGWLWLLYRARLSGSG